MTIYEVRVEFDNNMDYDSNWHDECTLGFYSTKEKAENAIEECSFDRLMEVVNFDKDYYEDKSEIICKNVPNEDIEKIETIDVTPDKKRYLFRIAQIEVEYSEYFDFLIYIVEYELDRPVNLYLEENE